MSRTYKTSAAVAVSAHHMYLEPKIAVAVRDDLATWQRLNMTAFVVSGIAHANPDLIGLPYVDASNVTYLPMFAFPVVVLLADGAGIRRAFERARSRELTLSVYTEDLFSTSNDLDNRAAVVQVTTDRLNLVAWPSSGSDEMSTKHSTSFAYTPKADLSQNARYRGTRECHHPPVVRH